DMSGLLGVDAERETTLELLALGPTGTPAPAPARLAPVALDVIPLSETEVDYPALREMQRASSLATASDVVAWRRASAPPSRAPGGPGPPRPPPAPAGRPT